MPDSSLHLARSAVAEADRSAAKLGGGGRVDERALMRRAQAGDREAYGRLFRRRAGPIWQMAYLFLHDAASAEDVVQETFLRGLEHLASYRGEAAPKAWLCAIALNVCRQAHRRRGVRESRADTAVLEGGRKDGPPPRGVLTTLLRRETGRQLAVALGFLTEPQREVFVLHYVEELPYESIAGILKTTPGAARALALRARKVLREKLKGPLTLPQSD